MADQYEYRLNAQYPTMKMAVPFTPDVVFIYNPSNSWLYLNTTTYAIPTTTLYDLSVPPESYLIFVPYTPNTEYGGLLVPPPATALNWDCWIEFRRGEKELDWNVTPGFPVIIPLSPLPDPNVAALWSWAGAPITISEPFTVVLDFLSSDYGFVGAGSAAWGLGIGWSKSIVPADSLFISLLINDALTIASMEFTGEFITNISNPSNRFNNWNMGQATYFPNAATPFELGNSGAIVTSIQVNTFTKSNYDDLTQIVRLSFAINAGGLTGTPPATTAFITSAIISGHGSFFDQGAIVQFADSSTPIGSIVYWLWDFGDGSPPDFTQNPTHTYTADGVYPVTLCVQGVYGGVDCLSADVYINVFQDIFQDYY